MEDMWRSLIVFPLTAGCGGVRNLQNNFHDGQISSAVLMTSLVSVTITATFIFSNRNFTKGPSNLLWALYSFKNFMTIVCVVILFAVVHKRKRSYKQNHDHARVRKVLFLCLFSVPSLLHNSFSIAISLFCLAANGKYMFKGDEIIGILSRIVSIIFIVSEVLFASMYSKYKISSSKTTNYGIYFIIISNLTEWFKTVLREIIYPERPHIHGNDTNVKYSNSCYANSEVKKFEDTYLYSNSLPLETEFSFMITLMFLGILSNESIENHDSGHPLRTSLTEDTRDVEDNENIEDVADTSTKNSAIPSFLRSAPTWMGMIISVPFIVTAMIGAYNDEIVGIRNIYGIVEMIFYLIAIVVVICGFHSLRTHCAQDSFEHISSEELLLMFSNFGFEIYKTFNIGAFLSKNQHHNAFVQIIIFQRHFLAIIFAFYQTVFILQAERSVSTEGRNINRKVNIHNCCLLLHILNLVLWFTSTFALEHILLTSEYEIHAYGKNIWEHVVRILQPIIAFYHFHSSVEFYGFYRKFMEISTPEVVPSMNN